MNSMLCDYCCRPSMYLRQTPKGAPRWVCLKCYELLVGLVDDMDARLEAHTVKGKSHAERDD